MKISPYAKALVACIVAGIGGIAVGYADDSLTRGEFWAALAAAASAGAAVFGVPNREGDDWRMDPR